MHSSRTLHPTSGRPTSVDATVLVDIAEGLASTLGPQNPAPRGVVRRCRLLGTDAYDAWLLVWGPDSAAEIHDHDGSIGAMHVAHGALRETVRDLAGERPVTALHPAGTTVTTGATDAHHLVNGRDEPAVSVHVYSPPLGGADD
jgi:hypothetical protein